MRFLKILLVSGEDSSANLEIKRNFLANCLLNDADAGSFKKTLEYINTENDTYFVTNSTQDRFYDYKIMLQDLKPSDSFDTSDLISKDLHFVLFFQKHAIPTEKEQNLLDQIKSQYTHSDSTKKTMTQIISVSPSEHEKIFDFSVEISELIKKCKEFDENVSLNTLDYKSCRLLLMQLLHKQFNISKYFSAPKKRKT